MASIFDSLRRLGRSVSSWVSEGAARAVSSFAERVERNNSLVYEQRAHLPRGRRDRLARQHLTGERAFSSMLRQTGGLMWPGNWQQDRARQVLYFRRWVFVAADRICSTVAALPPKLAYVRSRQQKQRHPDGSVTTTKNGPNRRHGRAQRRRMKAYYEARYRKSLHAIKPHEEVDPVPDNHPLAQLLKKPNAWDKSAGQLWYELVLFLILTGNAYLWIVPDKAFGKPLEMWVVPSQWVLGPRLGPAGEEHYEVIPYLGGAGKFTIPADEIVHFHFKNPLHKIDGTSPIQCIAPWIDVSESVDDSRYFTFKNGTQATGALELGPKYDPDDIDIDAIGNKFLSRYQGERNAGMPFVLPPDVKMVPLTIAAKDMAYEGGFEQLRDAILAALAVPKGIAGLTDPGSDRALWGERAVFYEQAIMPRLRYIAEVFSATVCKRWDDELRLYWEDPTPPDPQQVNADLNVDYQHFLRTPNEGRAVRGLEPIDDPLFDEPWIPQGLQPFSAVKEQIEQQKQQAQQAAMQQQMMAQQQQGGAPGGAPGGEQGGTPQIALPESDQQEQQGSFNEQSTAEDAALDVNDQAWQDEQGAVQKAHEYNQRFEQSGGRWRLKYDETYRRWKAHNPPSEKRANGVFVRKSHNGPEPYTVAVDLDGTLAEYDGWKGENHFGKLRPGAVEALQALRDRGCRIIIFTTRGNTKKIRAWLQDHTVPFDYINENPDQPPGTSGKVVADLYLDDRAIDARKDWNQILNETLNRIQSKGGGIVRKSNGDGMHDLMAAAREFLTNGGAR